MLHKFPPKGETALVGIGGWGCRSPMPEPVGIEGVSALLIWAHEIPALFGGIVVFSRFHVYDRTREFGPTLDLPRLPTVFVSKVFQPENEEVLRK